MERCLRSIGWVLLLSVLPVSSLGAQTKARHARPRITRSFSPATSVSSGGPQQFRFSVTARDPEGRSISLWLLNPPPGLVFQPVLDAPSPVTVDVTWTPTSLNDVRGYELVFRARGSTFLTTDEVVTLRPANPLYGSEPVDLTGDGRLDVLARAPRADRNGLVDAGALYVWASALAPLGEPTATLVDPDARGADQLGSEFLTFLADATGDGVCDVLALRRGEILVWRGGADLAGTVAPHAVLAGAPGQPLGSFVGVDDVDGDGLPDVVALSVGAQVDGLAGVGALLVFAGDPDLAGAVQPAFALTPPEPIVNGGMRFGRLADLTGSRAPELVVNGRHSVNGVQERCVFVWSLDGATAGSPPAPATLYAPDAPGSFVTSENVTFADVTGDGATDVVYATGGSTGSTHVFAGGPAWTGLHVPLATLELVNPPAFHHVVDLTHDGVPDVLVTTADVAGRRLRVFRGGADLTGLVAPFAVLAASDDAFFASLQFGDVTGDGGIDLIAPESNTSNLGEVYVWAGGPTLTAAPTNVLDTGAFGLDLELNDVDADGTLDVLAFADQTLRLWKGGPTLAGAAAPHATLTAAPGDDLVIAVRGRRLKLGDVIGDARRDLVVLGERAGTPAALVFEAGSLAGDVLPSASLVCAPLAVGTTGSWLESLQLSDVTADGRLDVIVCEAASVRVFAGGTFSDLVTEPRSVLRLHPTIPAPVGETGAGVRLLDMTHDGVLDVVVSNRESTLWYVPGNALYLFDGGEAMRGLRLPLVEFAIEGAAGGDGLAW